MLGYLALSGCLKVRLKGKRGGGVVVVVWWWEGAYVSAAVAIMGTVTVVAVAKGSGGSSSVAQWQPGMQGHGVFPLGMMPCFCVDAL